MYNVFVYGTLMDRGADRILGRPVEKLHDATLLDYERLENHFYYVLPKQGEHVQGQVLQGITELELAYLDGYEGTHNGLYKRESTKVLVDDQEIDCFVYVGGTIAR